jgi:hypothetical protein
MGVRFAGSGSSTLVNTNIVTTAETTLLTSPLLTLALDFEQLLIFWEFVVLAGTSTTSFSYRMRRGSGTGGTSIAGGINVNVTAGNNILQAGCVVDTPGAVGPIQYSVTLSQIGATANGTVLEGNIAVIAL